MVEFAFDRRDAEFVLFEQFDLEALSKFERYEGMGREDFTQIIDAFAALCKGVIAPNRQASDREGCKVVDGQVVVPQSYKQTYKEFGEGGWIGVSHNPDFGGMGLPLPLAILTTEMGLTADPSFMFYPGLTVSAAHLIEKFAEESVAKLVATKMYGGEWTGTMCLTEPQAGSDVGALTTTATPIEGTDEFLIKGNKIYISAGDHQLTENIIHLVLARVPGDPEGIKGISLFLVPKFRFDAEGNLTGERNDVSVAGIEHKMGINGSATCSLNFGEEGDCRGVLVGKRSQGIVAMFQMMNEARIACGLQGVGMANAAYLQAQNFAKERVQFAKMTDRGADKKSVAIIEHPDVRRNLMMAKALSEGLRALLYQAAFYHEQSMSHPEADKREFFGDLVDLLTPICKAFATDQGFKVTELAIQVLGGAGYITEYGVEQYMRDVKIASIYEGTNGIQALDLLGRKMRLKGGGLFMSWMQEANEMLSSFEGNEELGWIAQALDKAKNALGEVAFGFAGQMQSDPELTLLGATPFLEMFGYVEVGRLWLQQASIAQTRLAAMVAETGKDRATLVASNADARFYFNKIKTAEFYTHRLLPKTFSLRKEILSNDRSALDVIF
ncbi:MAG: acyl-CoA dehydrogenase [Myxococcales bacterium]|nr:acyl-CoA dehydrogenase [Myxococcales bacterium]